MECHLTSEGEMMSPIWASDSKNHPSGENFQNHFLAISHSIVSGLHGNARKTHLEAPHTDYFAE